MVRLQSVRLCYGLLGIRPIRFEIRFERKKRFAGPYSSYYAACGLVFCKVSYSTSDVHAVWFCWSQSFKRRSTFSTTTVMGRSVAKNWRKWWHDLAKWHPRKRSRTSWRKPTETVGGLLLMLFLWPSRRSSLYSKLATYLESQYSMLPKQSLEYFQFYSSVGLGRGSLLSSNWPDHTVPQSYSATRLSEIDPEIDRVDRLTVELTWGNGSRLSRLIRCCIHWIQHWWNGRNIGDLLD